MNATYRPRKYFLYLGIAGTLFFLTAAIVAVVPFFLENPVKHGFKGPHSVAIVGGAGVTFFGLLTVLSIYTLVEYVVCRVAIAGTMIEIISVFRTKRFDATSVNQVEWKERTPGGKLILSTSTDRAVVRLQTFSNKDGVDIIRAIRRLIPEDLQLGWPDFCHFVALPLREGRDARQPGTSHVDPLTLPESARVFVTRRRYDWFFGMLFILSAAGTLAAWRLFGNPRALAILLYVPLFWGLLRFSTPKEGKWKAKWTATKESKLFGITHLTLPLMFVMMLACRLAGFDAMIVTWAGVAFLIVICALVIRHALKREKEQRLKDAEETSASAERWEAAEDVRLRTACIHWRPISL